MLENKHSSNFSLALYYALLPEPIIAINLVELHWKIIFSHFHWHTKTNYQLKLTIHYLDVPKQL